MFQSLRSRLLLSYVAVICVALSVVALAMVAISARQSTCIIPNLRQLAGVALGARREVIQSVERGASLKSVQLSLTVPLIHPKALMTAEWSGKATQSKLNWLLV